MDSISKRMAAFALGLSYKDIPENALIEAKRFLLDSMGCALAAVNNSDMQAMLRYVRGLGGKEEATVIGSGYRTNSSLAALMNSLLIRALDYNDIYWEEDPSHPSDIFGAILASAEANGKSGKDLLVAAVIAYELEMRWCLAAHPGVREIGWHHATLTQFVSPLAAGKLYDLSPEQMVAAIGISGSSHFTLGGVVAGHLTNMKNMADPLAVQSGVDAVLMAREGISGPVEVVEGKEGLIEVLNSVKWDAGRLVDTLGKEYLITTCGYKAFPSEALTHQPITAALQACKEHGILPENVAEILVETTTRGADILSDPSKYRPKTKETADHSLPYVIAAAVADGYVLPDSFSEEKLKDKRILNLLERIKVFADPEIDGLFPAVKRARVSITTLQGEKFQAEVDHAKGSPENPLTDEELISKFMANSAEVLSAERQKELIEKTLHLEKIEDIRDYIKLLAV